MCGMLLEFILLVQSTMFFKQIWFHSFFFNPSAKVLGDKYGNAVSFHLYNLP